jgi:3-oxoacyl-[acyl-carrier protein] reductase
MTPTADLAGKVAFVTGGSRGIGAAIVDRLARNGASVAFTYLTSHENAARAEARSSALGGRSLAIHADSADAQALEGAIARTATTFGQLDVVVINAGLMRLGPITELALADFDRMMAVNVRSLFVAARAAVPYFAGNGRIVAIGSVTAMKTGFPGAAVYAATKAAIATLARGLAIELAPRGITVNTIHPGPVETESNPAHGPMADAIKNHIPLRRYGHVDEIAGMVAYLIGPEAAFVTGSAFTIDGGAMA